MILNFQDRQLKRTGWESFINNALIIAYNTKSKELIPIIEKLKKQSELKSTVNFVINKIKKLDI